MPLEVKVGQPHLAIHQGYTMMLCDDDGCIRVGGDRGLYFFDTRVVSSWKMFLNGVPWELLNGGLTASDVAQVFLTNRHVDTEAGAIHEHTLGLRLTRQIGGGVHEDIDLTNHSMSEVRFNLEIAMRSDFADIFEVKAKKIVRRGHIATRWDEAGGCVRTTYANEDFRRSVSVKGHNNSSPVTFANGRMTFDVRLAPTATFHTCLTYDLSNGERWYAAPAGCIDRDADRRKNAENTRIGAQSSNENFELLFAQATDDLDALRFPRNAGERSANVPAAGIPWFVALFGRDTLTTSIQTSYAFPEFGPATLDVLASYQATERDDYRDAQPGKIMHELRRGELATLKKITQTPSYGTADATPLYLIALHSAWRAGGDPALLDRHLATAERCLTWIDEYGDRDGDGFQEYETRSVDGNANQSWKDSGVAVVYADGSQVETPIATCEMQGYVYDAWLRMAEIYDALGRAEQATNLRSKAATLFDRFNDAFWIEELGFYAFALDGKKRQVSSVASNPGHCLWSGIVAPERAKRVVERLMEPDMWSGWGIRTLSSDNPAYNPHSYQRGAVWPHDNGLIAQGFKRYGFASEAAMIAHDVWEAGSFFALGQMPEVYAGMQRDATNFPVQYLGANVPQAWAAGSGSR